MFILISAPFLFTNETATEDNTPVEISDDQKVAVTENNATTSPKKVQENATNTLEKTNQDQEGIKLFVNPNITSNEPPIKEKQETTVVTNQKKAAIKANPTDYSNNTQDTAGEEAYTVTTTYSYYVSELDTTFVTNNKREMDVLMEKAKRYLRVQDSIAKVKDTIMSRNK